MPHLVHTKFQTVQGELESSLPLEHFFGMKFILLQMCVLFVQQLEKPNFYDLDGPVQNWNKNTFYSNASLRITSNALKIYLHIWTFYDVFMTIKTCTKRFKITSNLRGRVICTYIFYMASSLWKNKLKKSLKQKKPCQKSNLTIFYEEFA